MLVINPDLCTFCGELSNEETFETANCDHRFHITCLTKQLQKNIICPICPNKIVVDIQRKQANTSLGSEVKAELHRHFDIMTKEINVLIKQQLEQGQELKTIYQALCDKSQSVRPEGIWTKLTEKANKTEGLSFEDRRRLLDQLIESYHAASKALWKHVFHQFDQFHQSVQALEKDKSILIESDSIKQKINDFKKEQLALDTLYANRYLKIARICSVPACLDK
ncbi:hypothetical protein A0J61_08630 [Choanephora cucurbitarum]|uniref:RING-type domain-containing protein n=1 Tax=Choanephora cucurbitarum TaxID=101091 RepID=A0A1C7N2J1_9FUNG|nr:hypothetical protein A0J61_08630 [Choanephora cucurbitarum]